MKSSINKRNAQKKALKGRTKDLEQHDNIVTATTTVAGKECIVVCRCYRSNGQLVTDPISIHMSNELLELVDLEELNKGVVSQAKRKGI